MSDAAVSPGHVPRGEERDEVSRAPGGRARPGAASGGCAAS